MGNAEGPSRAPYSAPAKVAAPLRPGRELACDSQPWRCKLGGRSQISSTKWARAGRAARKRFTRRRARRPGSRLRGRSPAPAGPPRAREREPVEPKKPPPSAAPVAVRPRDSKPILTRRPSRRQGAHCASEHDSPPPPPRRPLATRRRKSRGHGRFEQPGVSSTDDSDAVADRPAVPGQSRTPAWPRACPPRPRGLRRARRRRRRLGRSHAPGPLFRPSARFETLLPLPWPG